MTDSGKAREGLEQSLVRAFIRAKPAGERSFHMPQEAAATALSAFLDPSNRSLALGAMGMEKVGEQCPEDRQLLPPRPAGNVGWGECVMGAHRALYAEPFAEGDGG